MTALQDIVPNALPKLSWLPGDIEASLDALAEWVESEVHGSVAWYLREKRSKARWSRVLRMSAIVLAAAGAAVPFVAGLTDELALQWGDLAFALAAAATAFDRFFGLSSAWMRYLTAEPAIQRILRQFQFRRAALRAERQGRPPDATAIAAELELLSSTADAVDAEVERETLAWVAEFQSSIAELRTMTTENQRAQGSAP